MTFPQEIGGVRIEFAPGVGRQVAHELLDALSATIMACTSDGLTIESLWVSSAKDSHSCPSRHVTGLAIDISRVNGTHIGAGYGSDPVVTKIVNLLQATFESSPGCRENYGPHLKRKCGKPDDVDDHLDHIHWSVEGDHEVCTSAPLRSMIGTLRRLLPGHSRPEICDR